MNSHTVKFDLAPTNFVLLNAAEATPAPVESEPAVVESAVAPTSLILEKISSKIDQLQRRPNDEVVTLAISLARTIVEKLLGSTPELCEQRLTNILQETLGGPDSAVGVYINSANIDSVTNQLGSQLQAKGVALIADNSIAPGECLVKFEEYDLVSRIENQLDDIESKLAELADE